MSVTLGVSPRLSGGRLVIDQELRMMKSSLLYADRVNLVAPGLTMLWTLAPLRTMSPSNALPSIAELPHGVLRRLGFEGGPIRDVRRYLRKVVKLPPSDQRRQQLEQEFRPAIEEALAMVVTELGAHAPDFDQALESGAVTLTSDDFDLDNDADAQVDWFEEQLAKALADPSSSVVLDPVASRFARELGLQSNLGSYAASRSRRASTGMGLIERLPTFPGAPMSDVLEARSELEEARIGYRKAVKSLAQGLESAALEDSLPDEIDEMWHDEVQPRLAELRDSVSATRLARESAKDLFNMKGSGPTIAVVVAGLADVTSLLPTAQSAGVAAGSVVWAGTRQAFKARANKQKHDLVYLLETDRQLDGRRPR